MATGQQVITRARVLANDVTVNATDDGHVTFSDTVELLNGAIRDVSVDGGFNLAASTSVVVTAGVGSVNLPADVIPGSIASVHFTPVGGTKYSLRQIEQEDLDQFGSSIETLVGQSDRPSFFKRWTPGILEILPIPNVGGTLSIYYNSIGTAFTTGTVANTVSVPDALMAPVEYLLAARLATAAGDTTRYQILEASYRRMIEKWRASKRESQRSAHTQNVFESYEIGEDGLWS
jgi:hypothetical protein